MGADLQPRRPRHGRAGQWGGPDNVPGVDDTNRDYFLQSQPEEQIDAAIQQQ